MTAAAAAAVAFLTLGALFCVLAARMFDWLDETLA